MELKGYVETLMIGVFKSLLRAQYNFLKCHVPSEHLVEMSAKTMSLSTRLHCGSEIEWQQLLYDVGHVVVLSHHRRLSEHFVPT